MTRRCRHQTLLVSIVLLAAAGCSSGPPAPAPATSLPAATPTAAVTSSQAPSAAATESNPPGDIRDNQAYVRFGAAGGALSVKVPEGWGRTDHGASVTFTDKLNRIVITTSNAAAAPTAASLSRAQVPLLRTTVPQFAAGSVSAERRAGQSVVVVRYQGDSAQDPVTGKVVRDAFERYVYFHNGVELDLTLSGPVKADNVDPWRIVSDSVRWNR